MNQSFLFSCYELRYGVGVSWTNAREAKLVGQPVHVELEVGVDPESVWLSTAVPPAGDADHRVAGVRVLGEERPPAVTLHIIFISTCPLSSVLSPTYIASVRVWSNSADHALSDPGLPHEKPALVPGDRDQLCLPQDGGDGGEGGE